MDINLFSKVLQQNRFNYTIDYTIEQVNVNQVFKNRDDNIRDSIVYLYLDSWTQLKHNFCWWNLDYELMYIGSGLFTSSNPCRPWLCRPTSHKKDLISEFTYKYPGRLIIYTVNNNLTELESRVLEAYLINMALDKYHYYLTKFRDFNTELSPMQLINKKRGLTHKVLSEINLLKPEFLNGNYCWESITR